MFQGKIKRICYILKIGIWDKEQIIRDTRGERPKESAVPGRGWSCLKCGTWNTNTSNKCANLLCGK